MAIPFFKNSVYTGCEKMNCVPNFSKMDSFLNPSGYFCWFSAVLGLCCRARVSSGCGEPGLLPRGAQASHCGGFWRCTGARVLGLR